MPPVQAPECDDPLVQGLLVVAHHREGPLRRTRMLQDLAGPPLGDAESIQQHIHRITLLVPAQNLPDANGSTLSVTPICLQTRFAPWHHPFHEPAEVPDNGVKDWIRYLGERSPFQ